MINDPCVNILLLTYLFTYLLTYLLTYSLSPWCRMFFEKLIVTQLVKQQLAFFTEPKSS